MAVELTIPDMHCEGCERSVRRAIEAVAPGSKVIVDLPGHGVRVEGTEAAGAIVGALREAGYSPEAAGVDTVGGGVTAP